MKIILAFILLPFVCCAQPAEKETDLNKNEDGQKVISTDILGLFMTLAQRPAHRADIAFEYTLNSFVTGTLTVEGGNYAQFDVTGGNGDEHMSFKGYGISPELRFYPAAANRTAPHGFSIGLYFKYASLTQDYSGRGTSLVSSFNPGSYIAPYKKEGSIFGPGFALGYKSGLNNFHVDYILGYTLYSESGFAYPGNGELKDDKLTDGAMGIRAEIRFGYEF